MRAFVMEGFETPPGLRDDLLEPRPRANELLVRVHASSVNAGDLKTAAGDLRWLAAYEFPVTLGRDFAGVVEQTGGEVRRYRAGDEVFGYLLPANPTVHQGCWAERITIPEGSFVSSKPANLDMAHAGAAPLAALSAFAAFDGLAPAAGETVLVIGATGGVGSFFVQLAASGGAHVIAPALSEDQNYLRSLGVAEILDRNSDLQARVSERYPDGVDAVLDLVSHPPQDALLKDSGRLASCSAPPAKDRDASTST
jgi:NADPH2:quinone reductase